MSEQTSASDDGFDPSRLRTIADMRRSSDDRMVAGVCAGFARYLNIDPVVVRVLTACLAFAGGSGIIIYVAGWLLLPEDDDEYSIAEDHLPDSIDHEQLRRLGMFAAAAIGAVSAVGSGFAFGPAGLFLALVAIPLFYLIAVRPYRRRQEAGVQARTATDPPPGSPTQDTLPSAGAGASADTGPTDPSERPERERDPRRDRGLLLGITAAVVVVAMTVMGIYSNNTDPIDWPYFPLTALLIVGTGMVVGTFVGNGRPLASIAIPLAGLLLLTTVLPTYTVGDERHNPALASDIDGTYEQGIGNFVLDLTEISDLDSLDGRRIELEQGVGSLEVRVPDGLNVDVDASTDAGSLEIVGRSSDGAPVSLHHIDPADSDPVLHLHIDQTLGEIKVTRS